MALKDDSVDPCLSHHVFLKRFVAMFNTWALVSVRDPDWFSYQDVLDLTDLIEYLVFRRINGQRAPLEEVFKSYLRTMEIWMDQVNTHGRSLHDMVENPHKWNDCWKEWTPSTKKGPIKEIEKEEREDPATPTTMQLDSKYSQRMQEVLSVAKKALTRSLTKGAKGGGKHITKYDKGKGKGKGKGKKKRKQQEKWTNDHGKRLRFWEGARNSWQKEKKSKKWQW